MAKFEIKVNENIEIFYDKSIYKSKVQDVAGDTMSIYLPSSEGRYLPLEIGEEAEILYYGDRDKVYAFKCKVVKRSTEGNVRLLTMSKPYDIEKIQRRNFVRVSYIESVLYGLSEEDNEIEYKKATLLDLSGGGLRFVTKDKLEKEELITLKLNYYDDSLYLKSKIVRRNLNDTGDYIYGVEFIDISDINREKIIRLVFQIMRKQNEVI